MYKLHKDLISGQESVERLDVKLHIPFDPANTDYQAYLKWLEEGNTPEPADEPVVVPEAVVGRTL